MLVTHEVEDLDEEGGALEGGLVDGHPDVGRGLDVRIRVGIRGVRCCVRRRREANCGPGCDCAPNQGRNASGSSRGQLRRGPDYGAGLRALDGCTLPGSRQYGPGRRDTLGAASSPDRGERGRD